MRGLLRMGTHGLIFRSTGDADLLAGAASLVIPKLPMQLYGQSGVVQLRPTKDIFGTLENNCSHAFWSGNMENTPSSWDIEAANQPEYFGETLVQRLFEKSQQNKGQPIQHNEVRASAEKPFAFFALSMRTFKDPAFQKFCADVRDKHGDDINRVIYRPHTGEVLQVEADGKLTDLVLPADITLYRVEERQVDKKPGPSSEVHGSGSEEIKDNSKDSSKGGRECRGCW